MRFRLLCEIVVASLFVAICSADVAEWWRRNKILIFIVDAAAIRRFLCPNAFVGILLTAALQLNSAHARAEAAFAYGRDSTGRWWYGSANNMSSVQEAKDLAMQRCRGSGPNCNIVRQFQMGCFAFAYSANGAAGFATGGRQSDAEQRALQECASHRGQQCIVQSGFCDYFSENVATALRRAEAERAGMLAHHASAKSDGEACNLNAKAMNYHFQYCDEAECKPLASFLVILGDKILYHQGSPEAKGGLTFQMGKTLEATQEAARLYRSITPGTSSRVQATATYDGTELTLRTDTVKYAKSHDFIPDNTPIVLATSLERINIIGCHACVLKEYRFELDGLTGPTISKLDRDRECALATMR